MPLKQPRSKLKDFLEIYKQKLRSLTLQFFHFFNFFCINFCYVHSNYYKYFKFFRPRLMRSCLFYASIAWKQSCNSTWNTTNNLSRKLTKPWDVTFLFFDWEHFDWNFACFALSFFCKKVKTKKSKLVLKIENSLEKTSKKFCIQKKSKQLLYLFLFVFLPIPFAGLYSGAILSAFLKLKTFESIISITLGNLFNCFLIYLLCLAFKSFISLFLSVIIILIILASCYKIISFIFNKNEKRA